MGKPRIWDAQLRQNGELVYGLPIIENDLENIQIIEKSAYDKAIECLKYLDDPAADSFVGEQLIKKTLEELGEE